MSTDQMQGATVVAPLPAPLRGSTSVPGDKSISHRAVLFAAMAEGTSRLSGVLDSQDVRSSIRAVRALGDEEVERLCTDAADEYVEVGAAMLREGVLVHPDPDLVIQLGA